MNQNKKVNGFLLFLVIMFPAFLFADELYNYKIYGQNKKTGLVVAGHVWESDKNGNLVAKIYDKMQIQDQCVGQWVGYGVAEISCESGDGYIVEVVKQ